MKPAQFKLPLNIQMMGHRERIMAKRELYRQLSVNRPFGLIELFTTKTID